MCVIVLEERAELAQAKPEKLRGAEGGILWCSSPDDPRCSPVEHDSNGAFYLGTSALRGGPQSGLELTAPEGRVDFPTTVTGGFRDGSRRRVDRPPRP